MILGIETATALLGVAVAEEGRIAANITIDRPSVHDELLAPLCRDLLRYCGAVPADIRGIAISAGPGSFTGLRIGMAVAKGMALSLDIPLALVPTLDGIASVMAMEVNNDTEREAAVFLRARRNEVYAAAYLLRAGSFLPQGETVFIPVEKAAAGVHDGMLLAGDAAAEVRDAAGSGTVFARPLADAGAIALLGAEKIARREVADAASCEPMYIQDFEVKQGKNLLSRP